MHKCQVLVFLIWVWINRRVAGFPYRTINFTSSFLLLFLKKWWKLRTTNFRIQQRSLVCIRLKRAAAMQRIYAWLWVTPYWLLAPRTTSRTLQMEPAVAWPIAEQGNCASLWAPPIPDCYRHMSSDIALSSWWLSWRNPVSCRGSRPSRLLRSHFAMTCKPWWQGFPLSGKSFLRQCAPQTKLQKPLQFFPGRHHAAQCITCLQTFLFYLLRNIHVIISGL